MYFFHLPSLAHLPEGRMRRGSSVQGRGVIGGVQETLIGVGGETFGLHREQGGHAGF